jgi:hypothetical protein
LVGAALLLGSGLVMRAAGLNVRLGQPLEFGWTGYPMLAVARWADPGGLLPSGKLPLRQFREVMLGTVVTWADGTKTLYVHR